MKLHLPKRLFAALMATFTVCVSTTVGADVISVNFGRADTAIQEGATEPLHGSTSVRWNNIVGNSADAVSGTYAVKSEAKDTAGTLTVNVTNPPWTGGPAKGDTLTSQMQNSYLDLGANSTWTIVMQSDYLLADVYLYMSGDGGQFSPVVVNGTSYVGGTNQQGDAAWGDRSAASCATISATNTICVTNLLGSQLMHNVAMNDANKRGTISGLQVVEKEVYTTTLASVNSNIADINWSKGGTTAKLDGIANADRYLHATAAETGGTLNFTSALLLGGLQASGGELTLTSSTDSWVTVSSLVASEGATLNIGATITSGTDLSLGGNGTINFTKNQVLGDLTVLSDVSLASGVQIEITGNYTYGAGTFTVGEGAALFSSVDANTDVVAGGMTFSTSTAAKRNLLNSSAVELMLSSDSDVTVTSTGGAIAFSKSSSAGSDITATIALAANGGNTQISGGAGVNLVLTEKLAIDAANRSVTISGADTKLTIPGTVENAGTYAINIGNGTVSIDGAAVTANSLIMTNNGYNKTSVLNIRNGGLLEITHVNEAQAGLKNGAIRLAHWGSNGGACSSTVNVVGAEFRALGAEISMGDDFNSTLNVTEGGVINAKGIRQRTNSVVNIDGGMLNLGESGIYNGSGTTTRFTNATIGALSANGWASGSAVPLTINGNNTVQLAVYDIATGTYSGSADINWQGSITSTGGSLTLAGSGTLTISHALPVDVHVAEGSTAELALAEGTNLNNFANIYSAYSGYGDSTTDGYASAKALRVAGEGSTLSKVTQGETEYDLTRGTISVEITDAEKAVFRVNTTVTLTDEAESFADKTINVAAGANLNVVADTSINHLIAAFGSNITVSNGAELILVGRDDRSIKGNLTITGEGSKFTAATENSSDHIIYDGNQAQVITVADGGELAIGANRWTVSSNTTIKLNDGLISGTGQSDHPFVFDYISNASIISDGNSEISGSVRISRDMTLTTAVNSGTLTLSGSNTSSHDGATLTKTGEGTLVLKQGFNLGKGLNVNAGAVQVGAALTIGGRAANNESPATSTIKNLSIIEGGSLSTRDNTTINLGSTIFGVSGTTVSLGAGNTIVVSSLDDLSMNSSSSQNGLGVGRYDIITGSTVTLNDAVVKLGEEVLTVSTEGGGLYITRDDAGIYWVVEAGKPVTWSSSDTVMSGAGSFSVGADGVFNIGAGSGFDKAVINEGTLNLAGSAEYLNKVTNKATGLVNVLTAGGDTAVTLSGAFAAESTLDLTLLEENGKSIVSAAGGSYLGNITIKSGYTLRSGDNEFSFGPDKFQNAADRYIIVENGATLDSNGKPLYYQVKLQEGATLTSSANDADSSNHRQLPKIVLEGDATVNAIGGIEGDADGYEIRMVGSGYGETTLDLGGHTLTKEGTGFMYLKSTTATAGTIDVQAGSVVLESGNTKPALGAVDFEIAENATLKIAAGPDRLAEVKSISGAGNLEYTHNSYLTVLGGSEASEVSVGRVIVGSDAGSAARLNLGANVTFRNTAEIQNGTLYLGGTGTYDMGSSTALNKVILATDAWAGTVKITDATISGATNLSGLCTAESSLVLNGLTVQNGAALTLGGNVTLGGEVSVAESITVGGALTFGSGMKLSVSEDMLADGAEEYECVITLLTGAGASAVGTMTQDMLSDELRALGVENSWKFNEDGTISFVSIESLYGLTWAGGDGALNSNNYTGGKDYADDCSLTFGAVTDGTPDTVTVDEDAVLRSMKLLDGADYRFTGTGSLSINTSLSVAEGANVVIELADGVEAGQNVNSAGNLKVNKITGSANVNITGGSLELSGANALANTGSKTISGAELKGTWTASGVNLGTGVTVSGNVTLTDSSLAGTVTSTGALVLGGTINITPSANFETKVEGTQYSDGANGFKYDDVTYTVVSGSVSAAEGTIWQVDGVTAGNFAEGKLNVRGQQDGTYYWVREGEVTYSAGSMTGATAIALSGGNLALDAALADTLTEGIKVMAAGTVTVGASATLDAADLNGADATNKVTLEGAGNYAIGSGLELGTGVELGTGWNGTVQTEVDAITADTTLALGDKVEFTADTVSLTGSLTTAGSLTMNDIRIDALSEVPLLNVGGILSAGSVGIDAGLLANTKEGSWTLIQAGSVAGDLQLQTEGLTGLGVSNLYNYTLEWDADNTTLVLKGEISVDYVWGGDDESFGGGESPEWTNDTDMKDADVVFGGSTASSSEEVKGQVTLNAGGEDAVKVNNVTITNLGGENEKSEYTFTGDDLASTGALNVSAGSTLNIQNNASFTEASEVTADSSLNVNGGSLTVGTDDAAADLTVDGSLSVADKGSLAVTGSLIGEGSLNVSGAETSVTVGGDMVVSGTGTSVTVGEGSSLDVTGAMTTEGALSVSKDANLSVGSDLDAKGALTMAGGAVLEVAGALKTDFITIEGELVDGQDVMVAVGELATATEDSITLTLADDTLENLAAGTYDLLQVMGEMAELVLDENIISTLFNRECKVSLVTAAAAGRTFGLRGAVPTIITLTVEEMTVDDKTWIVGNDKLGLNNDMFSVLGADGKLLSNSALDKALKIQINEAYELNLVDVADGEKTVHLNNLSGSGDFTVTGDGDTVAVSGTSYAGNLAINDVALIMDGLSAASLKGNEKADIAGSIKLTGSGSDYKGTYKNGAEVTILGGKHTLVAGDGLTVAGAGGTAVLSGVGKANLATTGTDVQIAGEGVTLTGSMDGGALVADITVTKGQIQALNLAAGSLDLSADTEVVLALTGGDMVLKLTNGALATLSTDSKADDATVKLLGKAVHKYFTGAYIEGGKVYTDRNTSYYTDKAGASVSANGAAGLALADAALVELNPQATAPAGALASVLNILDTASGAAADELGASLAGASTAVLGMAAMGDVDRQLKAIRNRTTSMGVDQSVANDDMPYFNAWINAEGDRTELSENGTESGYELNSWGGTVGFDVDCCSTFTAGMALTAMYGDLDTTGAASASGDLDTYYLSAFARYAPSAWTHTFVATVGMSDISLNRTVAGAETKGETDGMSFGLMYEVGRVFALSEDGSTCLQPLFNISWRHSTVDAYTEKGSDLALEVDEQSMDTVTLGLGARLQTVVGESVYNRSSILEARVLAKADLGDRSGSSDVSMAALKNGKASVDSAEMGAVGLEAGAGLIIPVGQESGNIFVDASMELRSDYTNVNATVGYRMNF